VSETSTLPCASTWTLEFPQVPDDGLARWCRPYQWLFDLHFDLLWRGGAASQRRNNADGHGQKESGPDQAYNGVIAQLVFLHSTCLLNLNQAGTESSHWVDCPREFNHIGRRCALAKSTPLLPETGNVHPKLQQSAAATRNI
jgi:hypothetical protein